MPKLNLDPLLMNGSGILSHFSVFARLEDMGACPGAWVPKSQGPFSLNPTLQRAYGWERHREGNKNPIVAEREGSQLNAVGLSSMPVEAWIDEAGRTPLRQPVISSVWGYTPEDIQQLIRMLDPYVIAHEINVSCPNVRRGETFSLKVSMNDRIVQIVEPLRDFTEKPLLLKLSPSGEYLTQAARAAPHVDYLTCGNTLGPGLIIDIHSRRPVLAGGNGGLSGAAGKPLAVKMVRDIYENEAVRKHDVGIVACGGIGCWQDIIEYTLAGASLYQIGTRLVKDDDGMGRTSEEIVTFTRELWSGVMGFCKSEGTPLESLVGRMVR
jgi:dihydroorotate dehydrogenase (NAD+) catalytic subunit